MALRPVRNASKGWAACAPAWIGISSGPLLERVWAHLAGRSEELAIGALVFLVSFVLSLVLVAIVLGRLREDYFVEGSASVRKPRSVASHVAHNVAGSLLIALGIVMSVPGVPGQGLLTILIGIMLLDVPALKRVERRLVRRPHVLKSINALRHRMGRPPLRVD